MPILPIVITGDPVLHTPAKPVKAIDAKTRRLVADMVETMHAARMRAEENTTASADSSISNDAESASMETPKRPNSAIRPMASSASGVIRNVPSARISSPTRSSRVVFATVTLPS